MMVCPKCGRTTAEGRFCERCGASIAAPQGGCNQVDPTPPQGGVRQVGPQGGGRQIGSQEIRTPNDSMHLQEGEHRQVAATYLQPSCRAVKLEMDTMCILFEDTPGFLRFRFNAGEVAENVLITLENPLTGVKANSRKMPYLQGAREITLPVLSQPAGAFVWYLTLTYEASGRKHRLDGEVQMVVVRPREAQKAAEQLTVTINNNITNGNASDVHVSQRAVEDLARLATAENPFEELRRIVLSGQRVWATVSIDADGVQPTLPPQPPNAVCDTVTLDLDTRRIHFFAKRRVTFGRDRRNDPCDISLRHPMRESLELTPADPRNAPYRSVSGHHCHFEHNGNSVVVRDGNWDGAMMVKPSSFGTFWNDNPVSSSVLLNSGDAGVLSFAGRCAEGALSLDVKVCRPIRACETCPHANRTWCGDGRRPALMLTRRDGMAERFVALWSCFPMDEADPSFEGVIIFRKEGGFAWRRGRRCGWLVPGTTIHTDFGEVTVS